MNLNQIVADINLNSVGKVRIYISSLIVLSHGEIRSHCNYLNNQFNQIQSYIDACAHSVNVTNVIYVVEYFDNINQKPSLVKIYEYP